VKGYGLALCGSAFAIVTNGVVLMQKEITIAYHAKSENRGWNEVLREKATWEGWTSVDRSMIDEILTHGHQVVTLGWSMWQVVEG
jgi:hypothetical protein